MSLTTTELNIFELGWDKLLSKNDPLDIPTPLMNNKIDSEVSPTLLGSGELAENLSLVSGHLQSANFVSGSAGWQINSDGNAEFRALTLTGGTFKYGKTSFSDSANAGYWIGSSGIYFGAASDATKLKYDISSGAFDFIGTISSRSTATLAAAIDASGDLITDIINAKLDSESKLILSDFNFGTTNYAGALKAGDIAWNATTGAITGGSGIVVYRKGIVGANAGVITFSIDATTGDATFAGTLSAAGGTLGTITAGTFTGISITATTIQNASSGARVVIGDSTNVIDLYSANEHNSKIVGGDNELQLRMEQAGGYVQIYAKNDATVLKEVMKFDGDAGASMQNSLAFNAFNIVINKTGAGAVIPLSISNAGTHASLYLNCTHATTTSALFYGSTVGANRGIELYLTKTTNNLAGIQIEHSGIGPVAYFIPISNANRVLPTVLINAIAGQGPHLRMNPITTAPSTPSEGDIYTDAISHSFKYYAGSTPGWLHLAMSDGTTGGANSAGAGNQYVELNIGGTTYKVLHDGAV